MVSKIKTKFINSLRYKKYRDRHNAYVVEGEKIITELLRQDLHRTNILFTTANWAETIDRKLLKNVQEHYVISEDELKKLSFLKSPSKGLAVVTPPAYEVNKEAVLNSLSLVLDTIQDPGNLGTIIRIANWFGISRIFCSEDSADQFNPKVIQASMGAILRTEVYYSDLISLLREYRIPGFPVYGTFSDGKPVYDTRVLQKGFIIFGNESKGITPGLFPYITEKISVPNYPSGRKTMESLNISAATAIICAEFRRRTYQGHSK